MSRFIIFVIYIFLSSSALLAQEKKSYIIGIEDYQRYPFQYVKAGEYHGRFKELLDQFAREHDIIFTYRPLKINNLYQELFSGKVDFKFPDNPVWRSPEKRKYEIFYSDIITNYIDGIFVRREDIKKDFSGFKKFGVMDDIILWSLSNRKNKGDAEIIKSTSCAELVSMLKNNDLDAIFCNYDVMTYLLKNSSQKGEIIFNANLPLIDNYLHLSTINHQEILSSFNSWISKNRELIERMTHEN